MPNILILDDERVACDSLRALLVSLKQWNVEARVTPAQALNFAAENPLDLFVVDWNLCDDMNGLQVAEAIRKLKPGLPVIVLSGYSSDEVQEQLACLPRTWLIGKPCPLPELLCAIEKALAGDEGRSQK